MLRALEPEDLEFLYTLENDATMWNTSMRTAPLSRYHLRDYIASNTADIYRDSQVRLLAEYQGKKVGLADLFNFEPQNAKAEIGLTISQQHAGKGYGGRVLEELIRYATSIHLHQIYAFVGEDNTPCLTLLQKHGFIIVTSLRDWLFDGKKYKNAVLLQKIL